MATMQTLMGGRKTNIIQSGIFQFYDSWSNHWQDMWN